MEDLSLSNPEETDMQKGPTRPFMIWCILYLVMLAVLFLLSDLFIFQILLAVLLTAGFVLCAWLSDRNVPWLPDYLCSRSLWIGAIVSTIAAAVAVFLTMSDYRALQHGTETTVEVNGVVEQVYYATDSGASFLLDLKTVDGSRSGGKLRVEAAGSGIYANKGETVSFTAVLGTDELISSYEENIQYDFPDGILAHAGIDGEITKYGTRVTFRGICDTISAWCRRQLYRYLPEDAAELCISILLGDKSVLSPAVKRDFRRIGVSHILAVSGMHISVLISGIMFAMRRSDIPYRLRYLLILLLVAVYMGVTGCAPSVMRAGLMWILTCLAAMLYEQTDPLTSLFFAAAVICLISPQAIFDVGLLLSVSATLGLILLMEPINDCLYSIQLLRKPYMRPLRALIGLTATTLAASAFTAPITLLVFGELSVAAPIANLILHLPVVVLMYCVLGFLLLTLLGNWLPIDVIIRFLSGAVSGDAALIEDLTAGLARLPHSLVGVRYWFTAVLLAVFLIVSCYFIFKRKRALFVYPTYGIFMIVLLAAVQLQAFAVRGDVALTYSVNRRNDNISVVTDGRGMIIDASDGSWKNMRLAWEQLSEQNITELEVCVLTHYHTRHTSMMNSLLQNVVVEAILLPEPMTEEENTVADALQQIAESMGVKALKYRRGEDDIVFGEAALTVFPHTVISRSAQPVLGWGLSAHGEDIVYLGGAAFETPSEDLFSVQRDRMLEDCDYLFLGIHGPLYKANLPPLSDSAPKIRAAAAANAEVRSWLADAADKIPVYTVDADGAVRLILK